MTTTPATSADKMDRLRERATELERTLACVDGERWDAVERASRRDE